MRAPRVIVEGEDDSALVERCRGGDRGAFTELVVRYQRPVYNAALGILRRPEPMISRREVRLSEGTSNAFLRFLASRTAPLFDAILI